MNPIGLVRAFALPELAVGVAIVAAGCLAGWLAETLDVRRRLRRRDRK